MPVTRKWAYFDHAAVAPLPTPTIEEVHRWAKEGAEEGDTIWPQWACQLETARGDLARLINSKSTEIAFVSNTTFGINIVADGFDWQPGDNVVLPEGEFPSNVYPWLNLQQRGVEVRFAPRDGVRVCPNRMAELCDERTRMVSVSWVGFASGYRLDVDTFAEMAHDHGALFFLDAIQGLGVFPLDVSKTKVDFLAADGHKWMMAPEGAGMLYIREENLEKLRPQNVGWNSVQNAGNYGEIELKLRPSANRFEGGSPNMVGGLALGASVRLLMEYGVGPQSPVLGDRVIAITDQLCRELADVGAVVHSIREPDCASGIVSFDIPGHEPADLRKQLTEYGVATSDRDGHLRASLHGYNDSDDINRLCDAIRQIKNEH